ncbi:MAG: CAF17-like 4Fe-4S cluster assembly/insertion protein YgfZ [Microthrixaceae bacterium]
MADLPDLRTSLGAVPLVRDVVRVQGRDAVAFLQGQLSQDIESLGPGTSARSLLLQPTGKVDAWLRVTRVGEEDILLDVDRGFGEAVAARLRRFKLRTEAEIDAAPWAGLALRGPGAGEADVPRGALTLPAGWPGVDGVDVLSEGEVALAGVPLVAGEALEALRVECGVPAMGAELTDATIPAEAGRWLIDTSVSFTKGCYTGQELVARIDSRGGNVPHPLRGLLVRGALPPAGAEVVHGDASVGSVTSSAHSPRLGAIALAVLTRATEVDQVVMVRWRGGESAATVSPLPFS